jgi:hypothetical protein
MATNEHRTPEAGGTGRSRRPETEVLRFVEDIGRVAVLLVGLLLQLRQLRQR